MGDLQPGKPQPPRMDPHGSNSKATPGTSTRASTCTSGSTATAATPPAVVGIGPALMDADWRYGGSIEQIHASIAQGRPNGMPSFRDKIPDDQIWEIAAYVRTLSGNAPKYVEGGGTPGHGGGAADVADAEAGAEDHGEQPVSQQRARAGGRPGAGDRHGVAGACSGRTWSSTWRCSPRWHGRCGADAPLPPTQRCRRGTNATGCARWSPGSCSSRWYSPPTTAVSFVQDRHRLAHATRCAARAHHRQPMVVAG